MEIGINCQVKKDFWEFLFRLASSAVVLEKNDGCNVQSSDNLIFAWISVAIRLCKSLKESALFKFFLLEKFRLF